MFNENFYPTPSSLCREMKNCLYGNKVEFKTILEPSAGKGDIAESVNQTLESIYSGYNRNYNKKPKIDCIEIEPELQAILKDKGFRVIHDDFLTFDTLKQYDLIIMNPPFDDGCKHLLKAIELQENNGGGKIVCLLNAETIRNEFSNARKFMNQKLKDYGAEIKYFQNAFNDAERKTGVEVAMVTVDIPKREHEGILLNKLKKEHEQKLLVHGTSANYVARYGATDFLDQIVEMYNFEANVGAKVIAEYETLKPYMLRGFGNPEQHYKSSDPIIHLTIKTNGGHDEKCTTNEYLRALRYKYWEHLFDNPKFTGKLTSNLVRKLHEKLDELQDYDFTIFNIMELQQEVMRQTIKGIEETIIELFDELSHKVSYWDEGGCKNIHYFNGWKTNKAYKINKKVIIPLHAFDDWSGRCSFMYDAYRKLSEITKIFDYLDSGRTEYVDIEQQLKMAQEQGESNKIPLKYFKVTFYKKGTAHLEFTNFELLDKFNLYGCQRKGWLPPNYGKKQYQDMNIEEQNVVKEFSGGESEYNKIFDNKEFYIVEKGSQLLLEGGAE